MTENWKIRNFDSIEFNGSENVTHAFPDHFHYEYSIGISTGGLQRFNLSGASYLIPPHSIFLINPLQIHAHFPLNDLGWSYKSMYISPDFIKYLQPSREKPFSLPVVQNEALYSAFLELHKKAAPPSEEDYRKLINALYRESTPMETTIKDPVISEKIEAVKFHLSGHYDGKLQLDRLATQFFMDKYQLIRQFKRYAGVTPNAYLTIIRVEKGRQFLRQQMPVVEAALEAGFYDQSHFHHTFQHYTGITPGQYRQKCNILQDQD